MERTVPISSIIPVHCPEAGTSDRTFGGTSSDYLRSHEDVELVHEPRADQTPVEFPAALDKHRVEPHGPELSQHIFQIHHTVRTA